MPKRVVQLRAVTVEPYTMVMEYLPRGSLLTLLKNPNETMPWTQRHQLASDIAKGLAFLHHHKVYHRDLKSENVLLTHDGQAKLADFGLSKVKSMSSQQYQSRGSGMVGSLCWMAPEILNEGQYQSASDVYSYAMVLWELITRKLPYQGLRPAQLMARVLSGKREEIPTEAPAILQEITVRAWAQEPSARPNMKNVHIAQTSGAVQR